MESRRAIADFTLLVAVNAMWAAQYAAYKAASEQVGPVTLSAWTFLIAALVLLPFRRAGGRPDAVEPRRRGRDAGRFLLLAVLGLVPSSALLAWGTARSTASNAAVIYLTVPVLTALLAKVLLNESMTPLRWVSLAIAVAGVVILSDVDLRRMEIGRAGYLLGNVLILAACAGSSFYNVYSKRLLEAYRPVDVLVVGYFCACLVMLPLLGLEGFSVNAVAAYTARTWLSLLVLSAFSWGLAMVLWMFLLRRLAVNRISISIYLLPFLGVLISAIALKERVTGIMVAGGLLTLLGTALATAADRGGAR